MHEAATARKGPVKDGAFEPRVAGALSRLTRPPEGGRAEAASAWKRTVGKPTRCIRWDCSTANARNLRTCVPSRIRQPSPVLRVPCRRQRSWWQGRRGDEGRSCKEFLACGLFEGVDNIKNGRTRACAQVEDGNAGAGAVFGACSFDGTRPMALPRANLTAHEIESLHMTACQVDNVDVVAYAVPSGVG